MKHRFNLDVQFHSTRLFSKMRAGAVMQWRGVGWQLVIGLLMCHEHHSGWLTACTSGSVAFVIRTNIVKTSGRLSAVHTSLPHTAALRHETKGTLFDCFSRTLFEFFLSRASHVRLDCRGRCCGMIKTFEHGFVSSWQRARAERDSQRFFQLWF